MEGKKAARRGVSCTVTGTSLGANSDQTARAAQQRAARTKRPAPVGFGLSPGAA